MKVLVLDDHPMVALGCAQMLDDQGEMQFISASNIEDGYELYQKDQPDVVIVDLAMGSARDEGLRFIQRVRHLERHTPIVVFSVSADPLLVSRAMMLGASAYILKTASADELRVALRRVLPAGTSPPAP